MDKCSSCPEGATSEATRSNSISIGHNSVDLIIGLPGKLQITDGNKMNNTSDVIQNHGEGCLIEQNEDEEEDEEEDEDDLSEEDLLEQMGYAKSKPKTRELHHKEEEEEEEAMSYHSKNEPPKCEPVPTPMTELKLVSALKGSREKEGKPAKECRVSWAPHVYDPSPSAEYFALNGPERQRSNHNTKGATAKNRQKNDGKGAGTSEGKGKGSRGKDKKQGKKRGGRGSKYPEHG